MLVSQGIIFWQLHICRSKVEFLLICFRLMLSKYYLFIYLGKRCVIHTFRPVLIRSHVVLINIYTDIRHLYKQIIIIQMKEITQISSLILLLITLLLTQTYITYREQGPVKTEFSQWCERYGKQFETHPEITYRYQIFRSNKIKVEQHNKLAVKGLSKYFMGLNRFAATTQEQYQSIYSHFKIKNNEGSNLNITLKCTGSISDAPNPPDLVNWTDRAVDKNVIDQKKCAANWAISAVGAIQGLYAIRSEKFVKLSDQQVIDCSGDYGNEGCGGGFMEQAYWYVIDNGMASDKSYPYFGQNQTCRYSQSQKIVKLGRCAKVPSQVYNKLISAVVQQPVSVAVASTKFMLYQRGIFDSECSTDLDRGMLLVGYGTQGQQDYWIIKNSLGLGWGERGYIRLKRTHQDGPGLCGIQLAASVPQNVE